MIIAKVRDRDIKLTPLEPVTSGSVGLQVKWEFDEHWRDLVKTAVFKGSGDARDVAIVHISGEDKDVEFCTVPKDVLKEAGGPLEIGVYGRTTNGAIVKPTIWGRINFIRLGVELSEADPSEPEPDWTAQVQQIAAEALEKANEVEERANNGEFDGADGEDGFSPTVEVEEVEGGHKITITDKNGDKTFYVMDGTGGGGGEDEDTGGLIVEDEQGNTWHFLAGAGNDGDIVIEDEEGNLWHAPAGLGDEGDIPIEDESGGTWHLVSGSGSSGGGEDEGGGTLPDGGTNGQYLVRDTTAPGGARWADLPVYEPTESTWSVTPLVGAATTLNTAGNYLNRDIVIQAIPYAEVSNQTGGKTATIGG